MYILQLVKLKVSGKNNITIWVYNRSKLCIYFRNSAHKIDQYSFKASHVWTGHTIEIRKQHWNDVTNGYSDNREARKSHFFNNAVVDNILVYQINTK